jgi:hypothetical protein
MKIRRRASVALETFGKRQRWEQSQNYASQGQTRGPKITTATAPVEIGVLCRPRASTTAPQKLSNQGTPAIPGVKKMFSLQNKRAAHEN